LELGELGRLVREETARLQLEQRRDQDEELAARVEIELVALRQPLEEGQHDAGHVELAQIQLVLEDEGQQEVERALERVEIELELPDDHGRSLAALPDAAPRDGHPRPRRHRPRARLRLRGGRRAQELPPDEEGDARDEADERDPEVQALPEEMMGRVDPRRLLEAPERAVDRHVEREERRPPELEAPV